MTRAVPRFVRGLGAGLLASLLIGLSVPADVQAAPGDLDPTFGSGGTVITDSGGFDAATALVLQPDGKIVVAGFSFAPGVSNFILARYNADGSLDGGFGSEGMVSTNLGGFDQAFALALQPDGKIVVAGLCCAGPKFALARYNADGSLHASFGNGGKVTTDFGGAAFASALALQPDGKIVVAGSAGPGSGNFALVRYNADGSLDAGFGNGGKVTTDFGGAAFASALALQPDGKIVAAGFFHPQPPIGNSSFALARYNADGGLDLSFGLGGTVLTDFSGAAEAHALALQPDGKIVAAGFSVVFNITHFALARYNAEGSLDPSFGSGGKVAANFGGLAAAAALALQPDGKIVVAGTTVVDRSKFFNGSFFTLARYNAEGSLDAGFGSGIEFTTALRNLGLDQASALALQPDGKIVVAGLSRLPVGESNLALARYRGDPKIFLDLMLNQTAFAPGDIVKVGTREANSGPEASVDKYLGMLLPAEAGPDLGCPANDPVAFVIEGGGIVMTCLSAPPQSFPPFARNVTLPADLPLTVTENVFSSIWPPEAPAGAYTVFMADVLPGALADGVLEPGDLLVLATASVNFTP